MQDHLRQDLGMDCNTFKSCQGFFVHMGGTYEVIKPYLHGLFLAENAWRDNRDSQGYRVTKKEGDTLHEDSQFDDGDSFEDEEEAMELAAALDDVVGSPLDLLLTPALVDAPPMLVTAVPRLHLDFDALDKIFAGDTPIQAIKRPVSGACCVVFGGGDASGEGFGSLTSPFGMLPLLRQGFWGVLGSSNWQEMRNIIRNRTISELPIFQSVLFLFLQQPIYFW
jgi:hypothetical protein